MMTDAPDSLSTLPLARLKHLLSVQDAKLELIGDTDPTQRAEVEAKRARILEQIAIRTDSTPRLPYSETE